MVSIESKPAFGGNFGHPSGTGSGPLGSLPGLFKNPPLGALWPRLKAVPASRKTPSVGSRILRGRAQAGRFALVYQAFRATQI